MNMFRKFLWLPMVVVGLVFAVAGLCNYQVVTYDLIAYGFDSASLNQHVNKEGKPINFFSITGVVHKKIVIIRGYITKDMKFVPVGVANDSEDTNQKAINLGFDPMTLVSDNAPNNETFSLYPKGAQWHEVISNEANIPVNDFERTKCWVDEFEHITLTNPAIMYNKTANNLIMYIKVYPIQETKCCCCFTCSHLLLCFKHSEYCKHCCENAEAAEMKKQCVYVSSGSQPQYLYLDTEINLKEVVFKTNKTGANFIERLLPFTGIKNPLAKKTQLSQQLPEEGGYNNMKTAPHMDGQYFQSQQTSYSNQ